MPNECNLRRRKLIGAIFGNLELIPFDPELDPEPFTCYNCWSDEHFPRDCPEPATHEYCRNCGRRHVDVQDCPRCAKAYAKFLDDWRGKEQERRQLSAALYNSRQFFEEEDLCASVDSARKNSGECTKQRRCRRETDSCGGDFEVKNVSREECGSSAKSLTSEQQKRMFSRVDDECWFDSDDDVYQSVFEGFAGDGDCVAMGNCDNKFQSEHYESVQGNLVAWNEIPSSAADEQYEQEFCSDADDTDYESTRAAFIRECNSVNSDGFEEKSSESSSLSFSDEYHEFSDGFRATRDAQLNDLFAYMRNQKIQDQFAANSVVREGPLKTPARSKSARYYDEVEVDEVNYDDVIVDENERSESLCSEDYGIQEFLDLLDAVKHLPIEIQNITILHFVSERKRQSTQNQERMLPQCNSKFTLSVFENFFSLPAVVLDSA